MKSGARDAAQTGGSLSLSQTGHKRQERKKTQNPREGWEDGTPPPHRDFNTPKKLLFSLRYLEFPGNLSLLAMVALRSSTTLLLAIAAAAAAALAPPARLRGLAGDATPQARRVEGREAAALAQPVAELCAEAILLADGRTERAILASALARDLRQRVGGSRSGSGALWVAQDADSNVVASCAIEVGRLSPAALDENRLRGQNPLEADVAERPLLSSLAVSPDWRRRGLAQRLCREAEGLAREWGYDEVLLKVERDNRRARKLYRKLGYRDVAVDAGAERPEAGEIERRHRVRRDGGSDHRRVVVDGTAGEDRSRERHSHIQTGHSDLTVTHTDTQYTHAHTHARTRTHTHTHTHACVRTHTRTRTHTHKNPRHTGLSHSVSARRRRGRAVSGTCRRCRSPCART